MGVFDIREINAKALGSRERSFLQVLTISRKPSVDFNSSQSFISPYSSTRCTIYVLCLSRSSVLTSTSQKRWVDILFTHSLFDIILWHLSYMLQNYEKQLQLPNETRKNIINQENGVFRLPGTHLCKRKQFPSRHISRQAYYLLTEVDLVSLHLSYLILQCTKVRNL